MVAASIWSLIIPAMEQSADKGRLSFLPCVIGFWLGILFLLLLDSVIPHLHLYADKAEGVKSKAADFREKAEPKVKKAAQDIRDRSVEAFGNLKDIIKEKTSQGECAAAADKEDGYAADSDEYVEITAGVDEDYDESTQRDSEMERSDDTLPVEEAEPINEE